MSKAKKITIIFSFVVLFVFITAFTALGADYNYNMTFAKPQINAGSCYLEVVFSTNNRPFVIYVSSNFQNSLSYFAYVKNNYLYISPSNGAVINNSGGSQTVINYEAVYINSSGYVYQFGYDDGNFQNRLYLGNLGNIVTVNGYNCDVSALNRNGSLTFIYGTDVLAINKLNDIYNALQSQSGMANNITANADKNASNIQSNNDKNTQSIIDNQNQLAEQEKTETQNSGNDSVSDVSGSVPDKSAGMLSALQSLSNAVSYTGTSAKWTFPQMYIPAISGVTDRINLNTAMEIDFTYWVNQIPQDIRTVISAIATIGLVIFAFKELYCLISYVLTLKGGGNNE